MGGKPAELIDILALCTVDYNPRKALGTSSYVESCYLGHR